MPPAPDTRCPVIDFVEEIGIARARSSPRASLMAAVSVRSFRGVLVPCALM